MTRIRWTARALVVVLSIAPSKGVGQSLVASGGLGVPVFATDARARALGGLGVGLRGPLLLPNDPAAVADQLLPSVTFTMTTGWLDIDESGTVGEATATRFPVIGVAYPVRRLGVATMTLGSVLDQRWETESVSTEPLDEGSARVTDTFESEGGVAALRLGFARRLAPALAIGGSVGRYTGDLTRRLTRTFDSLDAEGDLPAFQTGGLWRYSGTTASLGVIVDLTDVARLSANYAWSGDLEAQPSEDTQGAGASFDVPGELRLGASGVLAPGLVANVAYARSDWSSVTSEITGETAGLSQTWGGGLEWERFGMFGRDAPLRVGYRSTDLPFTFGSADVTESAYAVGLGLNMAQAQNIPLARVDLALERGTRDAGLLSESFLRASLTLRVSGF